MPDTKFQNFDPYDGERGAPSLVHSRKRYEDLNAKLVLGSAILDVSYGTHQRERLDIFPATANQSPIMVFFHGGYWKAGNKESRRFPARTFNAAGVTWITVEYPLLPHTNLASIVSSARRAVAWIFENIARFGGDPNRIHVSGNSAGGHLVAMLAAVGWTKELGLADNPIKGATAISPLADLRVFTRHAFNETFGLTAETASSLSPALVGIETVMPMIVAVGGLETSVFHWQAEMLVKSRTARSGNTTSLVIAGCDHQSIIGELDAPEGPLMNAIFAQINLRATSSSVI